MASPSPQGNVGEEKVKITSSRLPTPRSSLKARCKMFTTIYYSSAKRFYWHPHGTSNTNIAQLNRYGGDQSINMEEKSRKLIIERLHSRNKKQNYAFASLILSREYAIHILVPQLASICDLIMGCLSCFSSYNSHCNYQITDVSSLSTGILRK